MADFLLRDVDETVLESLKRRAAKHRRSLQAELHCVLERAAKQRQLDYKKASARIRKSLSGCRHSDSSDLLRNDRDR